NLVLDTGVRSIVLFGRKFDSQFETIDNYTVAMSGYGKVKSRSGKLSMDNDILIADVLGSSVCVVLMPGGNLFEQAGLPHIDGIIGYQLFSRFIVKIDYKYRRISMYEPFVDLDLSSYESVPLIIKDTKPYVKASVATMGGHVETGFFHLDTGSSQDMLLFMREKKVATPKSMHRTLLGIGIGGKVRGFRGKEAYTLQIGERFKKKIIPKYVQRGFSNREIQDAYGSIGSGMLKDSVIIIDYLRQRFYFI
ncbi:MAG: hypothetical protein R3345_03315, partial [Fulvivirga sp.]|nr:hypothetical protein [Fulvivirga sp.]